MTCNQEPVMHSIQVDEEVFFLLQKNAKPFVDSPNTTLRRMLALDAPERRDASSPEINAKEIEDDLEQLLQGLSESQRTKAPKADLRALVKAGLLREGERLFLVDYQGNRVPQQEAVVAGRMLAYKGNHFAMSNLAKELLQKVGFKSEAVRGPSHWANAQGTTVTSLWRQLQNKQSREM